MRVLGRRVQKRRRRRPTQTLRKRISRSALQKSDCRERRLFSKRQLDALRSPTKKLQKQRRQLKTESVPSMQRPKSSNHCFNLEKSSGRQACSATTDISRHSTRARFHPQV